MDLKLVLELNYLDKLTLFSVTSISTLHLVADIYVVTILYFLIVLSCPFIIGLELEFKTNLMMI